MDLRDKLHENFHMNEIFPIVPPHACIHHPRQSVSAFSRLPVFTFIKLIYRNFFEKIDISLELARVPAWQKKMIYICHILFMNASKWMFQWYLHPMMSEFAGQAEYGLVYAVS